MNQIKINIPQGYEIDMFNKETGDVSFKKIEQKYPQSIEEVKNRNWYINGYGHIGTSNSTTLNHVSTKQRAEALLALFQLIELRDAWNKVDGFVVDWENRNQDKNCINVVKNKIETVSLFQVYRILHFGSS